MSEKVLEWKLEDKVAVLTMSNGENRLNIPFCEELLLALDNIEQESEALTLVVASSHSHIWCNGFDVDWVRGRLEAGDKEAVKQFLKVDLELRKRLLAYPLITIAAISGHVFGGGAVLSCCFDFRFKRSDRGFFCIPAIDNDFALLPGTAELLKGTMPRYAMQDIVLTGRRVPGSEAVDHRVGRSAHPQAELMLKVMEFARGLNKNRIIVGEMKRTKNARILKLMNEVDPGIIEMGETVV
jgi:enoyl-CoA hydratase/carnithine racemase